MPHPAKLATPALRLQLAQLNAINAQRAFIRQKTGQQIQQRTLARAALPDQRHAFARRQREVERPGEAFALRREDRQPLRVKRDGLAAGELQRAFFGVLNRGFKEGFQTVGRANRLRFGVIKGAEVAQRLEEFRCEDQRQETREQRHAGAIMAKIQLAQIRKAEVDRHQRDRQRGEKFQHAGGEKREAQHFHRALAEILRRRADVVGLRRAAMEKTQGFHAAQAVKKVAAKARQRLEIAAVGVGGAHADHRHKEWDQRGSAKEDQRRRPVIRENREHNQQRHARRQRHLRQVAGIEIVHIVNLLKDKRRPAAGGFALDPGGACLLQPVHHLLADARANMLPGVEADFFAQPDNPGAQHKDQNQQHKRQQERLARDGFNYHVMQKIGQQPGLRDDKQTAHHAEQARQAEPAAGDNALLFKPAGQFLLTGFIHCMH
ncbi:hypothetical protein BN133_91 [Cronobacter dublinensis 582]|nr:hypothetical protein BN133_91 [Cronobacter dublinensis 582]